ncbi:hypothetical protein [Nocardia sp. NPDC051463]|uniref:hypothetical protein n=1 Tax=Nocardia sp. NPDC051463 TaxID=3154845 RepID=UPI00342AAB22
MFEEHRTLDEVRWLYERVYDLPVVVMSNWVLLQVCDFVGGVIFPRELARKVLGHLNESLIPVIEHPHRKRWTILVYPNCLPDDVAERAMSRSCVSMTVRGDRVVLPLPCDRGGFRWIREPAKPVVLPKLSEIIAAMQAVQTWV